ncbi:MAG: hypothetical protein P4L53_17770 [Candidatus Obscuribacterales bacterium]|nr:hypothetical protein [Candidatus Obscuribacterales bacterium]
MKTKLWLCFLLSNLIFAGNSTAALAKHADPAQSENMAVIIGNTGEQYPIYGTGGIRVTGGHHGMFTSNMKTSQIEIDGSGITPQKTMAVSINEDFTAAPGGAYFVSNPCVCTLSSAVGVAGQEITICNAAKGVTVTYQTLNGETLIGAKQLGLLLVNNSYGQVDKYISDGKSWFRE